MGREKVIKGLEKLRKELGYGLPDRSDVVMEYLNSLTDAITMLKEQEAEMIKCKNCMNEINKNDWNFCPYCGKCLPHLEGADNE